jgi:hypothetical protein
MTTVIRMMKYLVAFLLIVAEVSWAFVPTSNGVDSFRKAMALNNNNPFENLFAKKSKPQPGSTRPIDGDIVEPTTTSSSSSSFSSGFGGFWDKLGGFGSEQEPEPIGSSIIPDPILPSSDNTNTKFGMAQRLESVKCAGVGALSASLAVAPVVYFHYIDTTSASNALAQWEFVTDMAAVQGALFAIVYRYAIRTDDNPMLNQGVVGAFVVVRTLSNIFVSKECSALPLQCK